MDLPRKTSVEDNVTKPADSKSEETNLVNDKPFNCELCPERFRTTDQVKYHQKFVCSKTPRFTCDKCDKKFRTKDQVKYHLKNDCPKILLLGCENCNERFSEIEELEHHVKHDCAKTFQYSCDRCNVGFRTKDQVKFHQAHECSKNTLQNTQQACEIRKQKQHFAEITSNDTEVNLKNPVEKKLEASKHPLKLNCRACKKIFTSDEKLKQHKKYKCTKRRYTCKVCCKKFSSKDDMNHHEKICSEKRVLNCNTCDKEFSSKEELSNHKQECLEETEFNCDECEESFSSKSQLRYHKKNNCSEYTEDNGRLKRMCTRKTKFACESCGKKFAVKEHLSNHLKDICTDSTQFQCEICKLSFTSRSQLIQHNKVKCKLHKDEVLRQFQCQVCNKIFGSRANYSRHFLGQHSGVKHFQCKECKHRFGYKDSWNRHLKQGQSARKVSPCEVCKKKFTNKFCLSFHQKLDHPDVYPSNNANSPKMVTEKSVADACVEVAPKSSVEMHLEQERSKMKFNNPSSKIPDTSLKPYSCVVCDLRFRSKESLSFHLLDKHTNGRVKNSSILKHCLTTKSKKLTSGTKKNADFPTKFKSYSNGSVINKNSLKLTYGNELIKKRTTVKKSLSEFRPPLSDSDGLKMCFVVLKKLPTSIGKGSSRKKSLTQTNDDIRTVSAYKVLSQSGINPQDTTYKSENRLVTQFKCRECPKIFSHMSVLKCHFVGQHLGTDLFTCNVCKKTFSYQTSLLYHKKKEHGLSI